MRPLTIGRLLMQCLILGAILFCVMVLALKFGAVHVSLYGLGRDLLRVLMGKSTEISSDYSLILNLRLPRIFLSVLVGASLSIAGHAGKFSKAANGATGGSGEARVGIEMQRDAFRVSGHWCPRE